MSTAAAAGGTPFHDLARYVAISRVTALRLSPDGSWLAAAVQTLAPDLKTYVTSIWRIPAGPGSADAPRRLTRSAGVASAARGTLLSAPGFGYEHPAISPDGRDLSRHGAHAKFLYFPDEGHWILRPGHAAVWYETVFAFLAQHVLGEPWRRPGLL